MYGKVRTLFIVLKVIGCPHPTSPARLRLFIGRVVSSVFNASEFHCEIYMDDPRGAVTHQSRCWPSPSSWCGASECSMVSTVVKPLSVQLFFRYEPVCMHVALSASDHVVASDWVAICFQDLVGGKRYLQGVSSYNGVHLCLRTVVLSRLEATLCGHPFQRSLCCNLLQKMLHGHQLSMPTAADPFFRGNHEERALAGRYGNVTNPCRAGKFVPETTIGHGSDLEPLPVLLCIL